VVDHGPRHPRLLTHRSDLLGDERLGAPEQGFIHDDRQVLGPADRAVAKVPAEVRVGEQRAETLFDDQRLPPSGRGLVLRQPGFQYGFGRRLK
jgi:hypothetical protein